MSKVYLNKSEIKSEAHRLLAKNKELRFGQAVYNYAFDLYPELCMKIVGTEKDCFYDSNKVEIFLDAL